MNPSTPRRLLQLVAVAFIFTVSAFSQTGQNDPEICGSKGTSVAWPQNLTLALDTSHRNPHLLMRYGDSTKTVVLKGLAEELEQVCPVANNRLVVFMLNHCCPGHEF